MIIMASEGRPRLQARGLLAIALPGDSLSVQLRGTGVTMIKFCVQSLCVFFTGLAFAASAQVPGNSLSQPDTDRQIVTNFDPENMTPILDGMTLTYEIRRFDDQSLVYFLDVSGLKLVMAPMACTGENNTNCLGLLTVTAFTDLAPAQSDLTLVNDNIPFLTAYAGGDRGTVFRRYDLADFGIARGNIVSSLSNFLGNLGSAVDYLYEQEGTVEVGVRAATDDDAASLNRRGLAALKDKVAPSGRLIDADAGPHTAAGLRRLEDELMRLNGSAQLLRQIP